MTYRKRSRRRGKGKEGKRGPCLESIDDKKERRLVSGDHDIR